MPLGVIQNKPGTNHPANQATAQQQLEALGMNSVEVPNGQGAQVQQALNAQAFPQHPGYTPALSPSNYQMPSPDVVGVTPQVQPVQMQQTPQTQQAPQMQQMPQAPQPTENPLEIYVGGSVANQPNVQGLQNVQPNLQPNGVQGQQQIAATQIQNAQIPGVQQVGMQNPAQQPSQLQGVPGNQQAAPVVATHGLPQDAVLAELLNQNKQLQERLLASTAPKATVSKEPDIADYIKPDDFDPADALNPSTKSGIAYNKYQTAMREHERLSLTSDIMSQISQKHKDDTLRRQAQKLAESYPEFRAFDGSPDMDKIGRWINGISSSESEDVFVRVYSAMRGNPSAQFQNQQPQTTGYIPNGQAQRPQAQRPSVFNNQGAVPANGTPAAMNANYSVPNGNGAQFIPNELRTLTGVYGELEMPNGVKLKY